MSINTKAIAAGIVSAGVTLQQAIAITDEVVSLIGVAETALTDAAGDVKFQAVMSGVDQVIANLGLTAKAAAIKAKVAQAINFVVTALNALDAWEKQFATLFGLLKPAAPVTAPPVAAAAAGAAQGAPAAAAAGAQQAT